MQIGAFTESLNGMPKNLDVNLTDISKRHGECEMPLI